MISSSLLIGMAMGASLNTAVANDFVKPSWYTEDIGFDISYVTLTAKWSADLDVSDYKCTPVNTYYVTNTGTGTGTEVSPFGNIDAAITAGNATGQPYEVRVAAGEFHKDRKWSLTPTEDCNFIATGGTVILSSYQLKTFTLHSGSIYKTNRSATGGVLDKNNVDSNGNAQRLPEVATLGEMVAGSWYFDSATNDVYVWAHDSRNLASSNAGIRVLVKQNPPKVHGSVSVYIEGFDFDGFQTAALEVRSDGAGTSPNLYLNSVKLRYCTNGQGLICNGANSIFKDVTTALNWEDGLNYHERDGIAPTAIEINGLHYDDGVEGLTSHNSSTMHDGGTILRVNCYGTGSGRIFHDVDDGTVSLMIGCSWGGSRSTGAENSVGAMVGTSSGDTTVMGLYFCDNSLSTCETDWYCNTGSTLYINNLLFDAENSVNNGRVVRA